MTYQEVYLMDNLTIEAKAIYGMLCSYAGSGATAYPSVKFMCEKLHITNTRFYKHMNLLVEAGVVIKRREKENGIYASNVYTLVPNLRNSQNPCMKNEGMKNEGMGNECMENKETKINNSKINNSKINNKKGNRRFTPPTPEEVESYCREKGYGIDPERFVDFYESKGWMIGKNKMKDWKAAVRTWVRKDNGSRQQDTEEEQRRKKQEEETFKFYNDLYSRYPDREPSPDDPFQ